MLRVIWDEYELNDVVRTCLDPSYIEVGKDRNIIVAYARIYKDSIIWIHVSSEPFWMFLDPFVQGLNSMDGNTIAINTHMAYLAGSVLFVIEVFNTFGDIMRSDTVCVLISEDRKHFITKYCKGCVSYCQDIDSQACDSCLGRCVYMYKTAHPVECLDCNILSRNEQYVARCIVFRE